MGKKLLDKNGPNSAHHQVVLESSAWAIVCSFCVRITLDAEAAFKKLTAAFEKLYDPAQQAASRAEANRRSAPRRSQGSSRSNASPNESWGGGGGRRGRGGGGAGETGSTGEAPRWCREGEYVPEQERQKEQDTADAGKRKVGVVYV